MNRTNNDLENLVDLFSNFYQTIIINESDKEKLNTNLHLFLSTFDPNDINFSKTQDFLKQMKQGTLGGNSFLGKTEEFSKCLPSSLSVKKSTNYETFTSDDYINNYNEIMNEMLMVEDRFPVHDVDKFIMN